MKEVKFLGLLHTFVTASLSNVQKIKPNQEMVYAQHKTLFTSCNQMMSANNTRELSKFGPSWVVVEKHDHNV